MKNLKGIIKYNENIAKDTYKLVFETDVKKIEAGQFVSILCENKTLRRPFSVSDFENGKVTVLYKLKGDGTEYISNLKMNDTIDVLVPLGNGFQYENNGKALLIGAGIGVAPLLFLKKELTNKKIDNYLVTGFKDTAEAVTGSDKTVIGGSVMDYIDGLIKEFKPEILYSCGPSIVLKLVCEAACRHNLPCQIAMEKVMACGIGVCRGCVVNLKNGNGVMKASVCKDGPVFEGEKVLWQI